MRVHAILSWYEEPPGWLAATISSLTKIGVDHLIAIDGAYSLYPDARPRSGPEQADTIQRVCDGAGISLTLHQPQTPYYDNEVEKRNLAFQLLNATATPFEDWCFVIDADEVITHGSEHVREMLAREQEAHCGYVTMWWRDNPQEEMPATSIGMPIPTEMSQRQSRFFRVLPNMRVEHTHYCFLGDDENGASVGLRSDYRSVYDAAGVPIVAPFCLTNMVMLEHRDKHRILQRREAKKAYYETRDAIGVEQVPAAAATS